MVAHFGWPTTNSHLTLSLFFLQFYPFAPFCFPHLFLLCVHVCLWPHGGFTSEGSPSMSAFPIPWFCYVHAKETARIFTSGSVFHITTGHLLICEKQATSEAGPLGLSLPSAAHMKGCTRPCTGKGLWSLTPKMIQKTAGNHRKTICAHFEPLHFFKIFMDTSLLPLSKTIQVPRNESTMSEYEHMWFSLAFIFF